MSNEYLLVHKSILPDCFLDVIKCRDLIESDKMSVSDACKICNISRSTFYKYKDYVFTHSNRESQMAIISLKVCDEKGVLSQVLNTIFSFHGNIITINQDMPIKKIAYINIGLNISELTIEMSALIKELGKIEGVKLVDLLAIE